MTIPPRIIADSAAGTVEFVLVVPPDETEVMFDTTPLFQVLIETFREPCTIMTAEEMAEEYKDVNFHPSEVPDPHRTLSSPFAFVREIVNRSCIDAGLLIIEDPDCYKPRHSELNGEYVHMRTDRFHGNPCPLAIYPEDNEWHVEAYGESIMCSINSPSCDYLVETQPSACGFRFALHFDRQPKASMDAFGKFVETFERKLRAAYAAS